VPPSPEPRKVATSSAKLRPLRISVTVEISRIQGCTRGDNLVRKTGSPWAGTARIPSFQYTHRLVRYAMSSERETSP
jgi:hypothetical protein